MYITAITLNHKIQIVETGNIIEPITRRSEKIKRIILILSLSVLLLATVGLLACGGNGSSTGQPRIYIEEDFVDVGVVQPGDSLDYTFHFTNEGDAPLIITDATIEVIEGC